MKLTKNSEVTLEEIAAITGKTKSWITQLAREGYFKSEQRGLYRIGNVWLGMLKKATEEKKSALSPAQQKLIAAKTEQLKIRNAKEARELITFQLHTEILEEIIGLVVAWLNGLPSILLRILPQQYRDGATREAIEKAINDGRRRLTERLAAAANRDALGKSEEANTDEPDDEEPDEEKEDEA